MISNSRKTPVGMRAALSTLAAAALAWCAEPAGAVEHPWYENPKAVVLASNLPGQTGNYVYAFHGQGQDEYLGLTYSTSPLQFDLFRVDGTNAPTVLRSVAASSLSTPGFRGVAISKTLGVAMTLAYEKTTTMYSFPLSGGSPAAVSKPGTHSFDSAAFSPDGQYLFSNALNGESSNQYYVKWSVSGGGATLTKVGSIGVGGRGRNLAYARIGGRDLVFAMVDDGKISVIDMTGNSASAWTAANLVTGLPAHSYGSLCVSGVNSPGATPHLTVATSTNNGATKADVLNVYALTVPASGAVSASLVRSFDEDAMTAAGFGDISDANRYGNTVYVSDDEKTVYLARPDGKLYAAQYAVDAQYAGAVFRVTPYVQHPATNAMSVLWLSNTNAPAVIEWWPYGHEAETRSATVAPRLATELDYFGYSHAKQYLPKLVPWQYRHRIEGLQPDEMYSYRVTLANGTAYSNAFRTAPAQFRPVRFIAYSDSETQPSSTGDRVAWEDYRLDHDTNPSASNRRYYIDQTDGYASNICTMVSREPDFYVIAGDLAEKGSDQTHWDEFWRHNAGGLNDPAGSTPILAAPGNHEYHGYFSADDYGERGMKKFLSYFEFEPNGAAVEADRQERFHRVDYGPVAVIFVDTNNGQDYYSDTTSANYSRELYTPNMRDTTQPLCQDMCRAPDFNPGSEQYRWLEEQLADAQTNRLFTFLVGHQCPFSVGYHGRLNGERGTESSAEYLSGAATRCFTNLVFKYGVDAWICGHDELYEHSQITGLESLHNGMMRQHTVNVYDVGMGGDGLRGCNRTGRPNPYEVYRAHVDSLEVYDANGTLVSGGKHYGHLEVNVEQIADGVWTATLTPVYVFVSSNAVTGKISFDRRVYPDEIVITNATPKVRSGTLIRLCSAQDGR